MGSGSSCRRGTTHVGGMQGLLTPRSASKYNERQGFCVFATHYVDGLCGH